MPLNFRFLLSFFPILIISHFSSYLSAFHLLLHPVIFHCLSKSFFFSLSIMPTIFRFLFSLLSHPHNLKFSSHLSAFHILLFLSSFTICQSSFSSLCKAKIKKLLCCPLPTDRKMRKNRVRFFYIFFENVRFGRRIC